MGRNLKPVILSFSVSLKEALLANQSWLEPPVLFPRRISRALVPLVKISLSISPSLYHLATDAIPSLYSGSRGP
ncbi:hypothetical protein D3C81_2201880 [compost metagenome]